MIINGWIIVDKPRGISSNDAVQKIKRLVGKENKVGHAGTLDPLAEGVLPIAIGEATKTCQYLIDADKEYEFDIYFGEERATGDAEGEVVHTSKLIPNPDDLNNILKCFTGEITQIPPIYSAIKLNGKPAYKMAREGKEFEMPSRKISIYSLELVNFSSNIARLKVCCSKGTYVRTLAIDIAVKLGSRGYVSYLRRTRVGKFLNSNAIMLANLINLVHNTEIKNYLLPVKYGLGDILDLEVDNLQALALRQGKAIFLPQLANAPEMILQISTSGVLQAIACANKGLCKPLRVFNLKINGDLDVDN